MFDEYTRQLIDLLPDLPNIDRAECRRALSTAYFYIVRTKLDIELDAVSEKDVDDASHLLRRMVDSLESVAVFDRLNGQNPPIGVENACAFVAAEALFLLKSSPIQAEPQTSEDPILQESIYTTVETALLYMIGGYDVNAVAVVRDLKLPNLSDTVQDEVYKSRLNNANALLSRLVLFCNGDVRQPHNFLDFIAVENYAVDWATPAALIHKIRADFYMRLGRSIDAYLDWLGGYNRSGFDEAMQILQSTMSFFTVDRSSGTEFADIYHLSSLLIASIDRTSQRSLIHSMPPPDGANERFQQEFAEYLSFRAQGDSNHRGRPFLWPSAIEYIKNCLPGPSKDAVISMPTGSGKSHIAELAITHALNSGWVLYLAPTNALVYQVRRDLIYALQPFQQVTVRAFIGNDEYTTLAEEQINILNTSFVAVMTPEKCSLAIRLYPEIFTQCSLCIFDECHLITDNNRGIISDILLAQLSLIGPAMRFLLMSAMVGNPEQLAEWLASIHSVDATPLTIKWRPSRTMRGLLLLDQTEFRRNFKGASAILRNLPPKRVNQQFATPMAMIAGLSGPWTLDGSSDYRISALPINFSANASRSENGIKPSTESWKNTASRQLAELFARSKMPTICFILSSRHHTFSSADKVAGIMPDAIEDGDNFPDLVEAWLTISDAELGISTILRDLLRHGIAVHSSAMLQIEQAASEWMFVNKKALLMFATGTLAQGLNLPAVAVVIAGTSMGDPRFQALDGVAGIERVNSMILNAFGRAGRPGFSNQGLAILVSDRPFYAPVVMDLDPTAALNEYQVLGEQDATIDVHSPVEKFIDSILASDLNPSNASTNELVLTSLLAEYDKDDNHSGQILTRTLAAYHKRQLLPVDASTIFRNRLNLVRENYFNQPNIPEWLNKAAMVAGVDYFRTLRMWQAYSQYGVPQVETTTIYTLNEWLDLFFNIMSLLPPSQVQIYLPDPELKTTTVLTRMRDSIANLANIDTVPWEIPENWLSLWQELKDIVLMYLHGESFLVIAQNYLNLSVDKIHNRRSKGDSPIPAVFGFLHHVVDRLAIDAGCFAAIHEMTVHANNIDTAIPETLQALPLCIRQGCDSLASLAWYRFGYRQRVCAHALQRNFPVPDELTSDSERADWVRQTRQRWLLGEITSDEPLIYYAKVVVTQTENQ